MISKQKDLEDLVGSIQAPNSGHARRDARQTPGNSLLLFNMTLGCFFDLHIIRHRQAIHIMNVVHKCDDRFDADLPRASCR